MKFVNHSITVFLCTVLIVACSGSGDGTEDGQPVASLPPASSMAKIDAFNAEPIAGQAAGAVFASESFSALVGGRSGLPVGSAGNGLSKTGGMQNGGLVGVLAQAATLDTTIACAVAGSVTLTGDIADPTTLSGGDNIRLQFSMCDDGEGQVLNGIVELNVNSFSGDLLQGLIHLNTHVMFVGMEVAEGQKETSFNGDAELDLDTTMPPITTSVVSGTSLSVSDSAGSVTLAFFHSNLAQDAGVAPQAYTAEASGTLSSTLFDGNVNYSTPIPFTGFAGEYPFAGELLVTGGDGTSVRLVVLDSLNVRLQIDPGDGSGIITRDTTWVELPAKLGASVGETGITGQVLMGPIVPGPEVPGQVNEAPFAALFHVLRSDGSTVGRFVTSDDGFFRVSLPPGEYVIVPDASAPFPNAEQQTKSVTVPEHGFADVLLRFDTGMR